MKKRYGILAVVVILLLTLWGVFYQSRKDGGKEEKKSIRIGVTLYRGDDSFINTLRGNIEEQAKEYEKETGIKVVMDIVDAKGNQNTQNSQVDRFISLGLCCCSRLWCSCCSLGTCSAACHGKYHC